MGKAKPYALVGREEGRGKPFTKKFATLAELSKAVQEQWQGADYIDGADGFHTDYSSYQLVGAVLKDIGYFVMHEDWRDFTFRNLDELSKEFQAFQTHRVEGPIEL